MVDQKEYLLNHYPNLKLSNQIRVSAALNNKLPPTLASSQTMMFASQIAAALRIGNEPAQCTRDDLHNASARCDKVVFPKHIFQVNLLNIKV